MNIDIIKSELNKLGIRPNNLLGQNFLVDESALDEMVGAADIKPGDTVVEIGPGLGVLTSALLKAGAKVVAIEQERKFGEYLRKKLKGQELDVIIDNAILKIPELRLPVPYKVVSNLPYSITSPVINLFLTKVSQRPQVMVLMVQKEVAERLTAKSGESERGLLTVIIELFSENQKIVASYPPQAFWPSPKVNSSILQISHSPAAPKNFEGVIAIAKAGFSKKRAMLKNALKPKYGDTTSLLHSCNIDPSARAEDLSTAQWIKLAAALRGKSIS